MGKGFAKKKKQARMMQEQLAKAQKLMEETEATGTAANGLVTIVLTGQHVMKSIAIKPECVDPEDVEGLQDLIKAAYANAVEALEKQTSVLGGLPNLSMGEGFPNLSQLGF